MKYSRIMKIKKLEKDNITTGHWQKCPLIGLTVAIKKMKKKNKKKKKTPRGTRSNKNHHLQENTHTHNTPNTHNHSIAHSQSAAMRVHKPHMKRERKRKEQNKLADKLQKVFRQCKETAESSHTTVSLVDSPKRKRKQAQDDMKRKRRKHSHESSSSLIVIDDPVEIFDKACTVVTPRKPSPVHCSTPNGKFTEPDFIPLSTDLVRKNNNTLSVQNFNEEVADLTREINGDSYLTIDLTTDTLNSVVNTTQPRETTVIDLENSMDNADCTVVSVSNANLSLSGESDVTVLNVSRTRKERDMRQFAKNIATMNASEKGRLLELITENIFTGCNVRTKSKKSLKDLGGGNSQSDTAEDTYIKEVIVGQSKSRNSIGSNIYNPERDEKNKSGLRMIVIDGSNVAMQHGRGKIFSVKGLKICIDYFLRRGHTVKAFVPRFRCKFGKSSNPRLLDQLQQRGLVIYTPSREIQGRMVTSYDDRYIVQCAAEFDGVIVSGDNYRDLLQENPRWRFVIENRLLPFTWVDDMLMFPKDPLGRTGPTLEQFLRHPVTSSQNLDSRQNPSTSNK